MEAFIGTILAWPMDYAPPGWAFCDGHEFKVHEYQALFALISNKYGGDGRNTWRLPDLRGRMILGAYGQAPQTWHDLAVTGGVEAVVATGTGTGSITLTTANLPAHSHTATLSLAGLSGTTKISVGTATAGGSAVATEGATLTSTASGVPASAAIYLPSTTAQTGAVTLGGVATTVSGTGTVTVGNTGTATPIPVSVSVAAAVPTVPPYIALNYIICLAGIYPSRG